MENEDPSNENWWFLCGRALFLTAAGERWYCELQYICHFPLMFLPKLQELYGIASGKMMIFHVKMADDLSMQGSPRGRCSGSLVSSTRFFSSASTNATPVIHHFLLKNQNFENANWCPEATLWRIACAKRRRNWDRFQRLGEPVRDSGRPGERGRRWLMRKWKIILYKMKDSTLESGDSSLESEDSTREKWGFSLQRRSSRRCITLRSRCQ